MKKSISAKRQLIRFWIFRKMDFRYLKTIILEILEILDIFVKKNGEISDFQILDFQKNGFQIFETHYSRNLRYFCEKMILSYFIWLKLKNLEFFEKKHFSPEATVRQIFQAFSRILIIMLRP